MKLGRMFMILGVLLILFATCQFVRSQEFNYRGKVCATAPAHKHTDVVTVTMYVTSWDGCELRGVIHGKKFGGKTYVLFGGFEKSQKFEVKQKIRVMYDRSCGQVLFAVFPRDPGINAREK